MNIASFAAMMTICGLGCFTILAAPHTHPDKEGLAACQKLHPVRYCRIANGFPVKPLP